jgi:hypothetical protein
MDDNVNIVLASNIETFKENNTISNFKSKLATNMIFPGEWECGISSISYTNSWYNISSPQKITFSCFDSGIETEVDDNLVVYGGRYDTIDELLKEINNKLKKSRIDMDKPPEVYVEDFTRIVNIEQGIKDNKIVFINFTSDLCHMLGFDKVDMDKTKENEMNKYQNALKYPDLSDYQLQPLTNKEKFYTATQPYDLSGGYHSLFVYSDIVKPTHVGNSFTQLLGLVEIPNNAKFGEQILIKYPNAIYVPLLLTEFDTIEISIASDFGEQIPFKFGRVIIVLNLRKVYKKIMNNLS